MLPECFPQLERGKWKQMRELWWAFAALQSSHGCYVEAASMVFSRHGILTSPVGLWLAWNWKATGQARMPQVKLHMGRFRSQLQLHFQWLSNSALLRGAAWLTILFRRVKTCLCFWNGFWNWQLEWVHLSDGNHKNSWHEIEPSAIRWSS